MNKVVFWDFGGTLANKEGVLVSALMNALNENLPGHNIDIKTLYQNMRMSFPWHDPENDYTHLTEPELWWEKVESEFEKVYKKAGIPEKEARILSKRAHEEFIRPEGFVIYDDTIEVLNHFKENGWRNIIVSNHVPELPSIIRDLKLDKYIDSCISSANVGYDKPNPRIFKIALETAGNPEECWMVGDNLEADKKGAESVGIKAILVRNRKHQDVDRYSDDLRGIIGIIEEAI